MRRLLPVVVLAACSSESGLRNQIQTDVFFQNPPDEIDILFVIDDSNSMQEEQRALIEGFATFIQEIVDANSGFHLGVTTTSADLSDPQSGRLRGDPPYVDAGDDYVREFAVRAFVGTRGSDKEKGLEAAALALSPEMLAGPNAGFLRDHANLLVVVVSDEEDCSDGGALDGFDASVCYSEDQLLTPVDHLTDRFVQAKRGDREKVRFGAIVTPALPDPACDTGTAGIRYGRAQQLLGGTIGNICSTEWTDMLYDLGLTATGVESEFFLTYGAKPESIVVTVDGEEWPEDPVDGWTYASGTTTIKFHGEGVPPRGAEIVVEYEIQV